MAQALTKKLFLVLFSLFCLGFTFGPIKKLCVKQICIEVEVADNQNTRANGLMNRDRLSELEGMLFIFDQPQKYTFWMKNMKFPLDIIWISQDKKIVDISYNLQPCKELCETASPQKEAMYVLEVNAGFVKKYNLKVGEEVKF